MKALTIKKIKGSSRSYGRGSDSSYSPAQYGIYNGETLVGRIMGSDAGYMEKSNWNAWLVDAEDGKYITTVKDAFYVGGGFRNLKNWCLDHPEAFPITTRTAYHEALEASK